MMRYSRIAAVLMLTACASPQERCLRNATPDYAAIDAQIAEAEANIARGYRLQPAAINTVGFDLCSASGNLSVCLGGTHDVPPRAVPIDVAAETRRLDALRAQRAAMTARAERDIAACQMMS